MLINNPAFTEDVYRIVVEEASVLAALYTGPEITITVANSLMLKAWDKDESVIGKPMREANGDWIGQPFFEYLDTVFRTGREYNSIEERADLPVKGVIETFYFNFTYKPLKYPDGTVWGIVHTALDVTAQVRAKKAQEHSESNFRNMINQSPVAMCIYSCPQLILEIANEKMLDLMEKKADEIIHKSFDEGLPELREENYGEILKSVGVTGKRFEAKEQPVVLSRSGKPETVYLNFSYTPIKDANGCISGILAVAVDVTDQVHAKMELKASIAEKENIEKHLLKQRERLNLILETMAEGVSIVDTSGRMTYSNPMAQRILGLSENEILSKKFNELKWQNLRIDGTPLPEEEHPMSVVMRTGKPVFDYEISIKPPDRERFYVSINAAAITNEEGEIIAGIASFMDVSNRRKAIQQKDDFISVASHELKTPLTSLNAGFQLMERELKNEPNISEKLLKIAKTTRVNLKKLSLLVEGLLDSTKIENGQLELRKKWFKVSQVIDECCDHLRLQGTHELQLTGDLEVEVYADQQKIDQVIVNFVNNAVKYAPESNTIRLNIETLPDKVKISVQDFGIGIEKEKTREIFNRFYQVDPSGLQFYGLGLGLYISSEIIKIHGGEIGVESEPGQGSTFWFTLPTGQKTDKS